MKNCMHCGRPLEDDAKFCTGCGTSCVPGNQAAAPPKADVPPAAEGGVFCPRCGAALPAGMAVCSYCGAQTGATPSYRAPLIRNWNNDNAYEKLVTVWKVLAIVVWILGGIGSFVQGASVGSLYGLKAGFDVTAFLASLLAVALGGFACYSASFLFKLLLEIKRKR